MPLSLVDSHLHFWQPLLLHYGWLADVPRINQSFLPQHVPPRGPNWSSDAFVFVQADCLPSEAVAEAAWVSDLARQDKRVQGIVAFAALETPDHDAATLDALQDLPLVKGIRRLIQSEAAGFCAQPDFIAGVQSLAARGYSFDLCIRHHQLLEVIALVQCCPDVAFVLDHSGKPDIKQGLLDPWRDHLRTLAQCPNVSCKLSGLVTEADPETWQPKQLTPYIAHVLETFGVERVMFGSDWPVMRLAHTAYEDWIEIALAALPGLSESEQQQIFGDNARRFYRLG